MSHGMDYAEQSIGESHTCEALRVMHTRASFFISVVGCYEILVYHCDSMESAWVCVIAVDCRYIGFDSMSKSIHACMRCQLRRHCFSQSRIYDGYIGSYVKVGEGIFYAWFVICDYGESRDFGSRTGCRWDSAELSFSAQRREVEGCAEGLKGYVGVFIECPHCFRGVYRRTAADSYDPVRFEFGHFFRSAHDRIHAGVRLDSFKKLDLHSCFFKQSYYFI